jgi:hypothetical protein
MTTYMNHGRWVTHCVDPDCSNAFLSSHVPGKCDRCGQVQPSPDYPIDKVEIERILGERPVPDTRNWLIGETVEDLIKENEGHGVDST